MASTYSPNLRLELIGTGEQQGTWGTTTNTNLGTLLEQAICGYASITVSDVGDTTLTTVDGGSDQSRNMVLNLTGTITGARDVICPAIQKLYVVKNATTGGYPITFKVSTQTGVTVPNGGTVFLYVDGQDAKAITGSIASQSSNNVSITGGVITGITDLAIADGGTGASTAAGARTNLGLGTLATQNGTFSGTSSGTNTGDQNIFQTISVAGQSDVIADSTSDTLTLAAGSGISITTNATSDTVTISATGSGGTVSSVDVSGGTTGLTTSGGPITGSGTITISGTLGIANGGTGSTTNTAARSALGLGSIATQNANNVSITGGSISGVSGVLTSGPVTTSGLTQTTSRILGRTTASTGAIEEISAGTGLTLSGGSLSVTTNTYQPLDADLTAIAAISATSGVLRKTAANTWSLVTTVAYTDVANTFTADQSIGDGTSSSTLSINGASGNGRNIQFLTAASNRWALQATTASESGSNAGSNFAIRRYSDSGTLIDNPLTIERSSGNINATQGVFISQGNAPGVSRSTSGSTFSPAATVKNIIVDRSTTLSALTVTLPVTDVVNGQEMRILTRSAITTLTVNVEGGGTIYNAPTTLSAGSSAVFVWNGTAAAWFRG